MKIKQYYRTLAIALALTASSVAIAEYQPNSELKNEFEIQKIDIAKKVKQRVELYQADKNQKSHQFTISRPGASFIKVHFEKFNLPKKAYIEVSNPEGTEVYRYSKDERSLFTVDAESGEDGVASFSAMSISGDTAIVRLVGKNARFKKGIHAAVVDSFMQGFSEVEIQAAIQEPVQAKLIGGVSIASTCGVNERRDAACWEGSHPVEFERSRPVARLLIGGSLCTAWRVGANNHMFTNEHCVNSQAAVQNMEVWFNYQRNTCGGSLGAITKVTGNTLLQSNHTLDYTLFTVNNFSSIQSFGHFGLDVREAINQEIIYIPQHGSGNPKELAIESDRNSGGVCRIDVVSAFGRGLNTDMGYMCDTINGSSGSPVVARSSNNVIALHHFGGCPNQGVKISRIWPQVSGFFGGVVPVGDTTGGNASPIAAFSYNCTSTNCSFDGSASSDSDGSITNYQWNFGDGTLASGATATHNYAANSSFNVTLTVTDDDGATHTANKVVSLIRPNANFIYSCTNLRCVFSDASRHGVHDNLVHNWSFGDGSVASGDAPSHTYASPGTYAVTITVRNVDNGYSDSETKNITVTSYTPPPAGISLRARADTTGLVSLNWYGATGSSVDIYRDNYRLETTPNDGVWTEELVPPFKTSYNYKVCEKWSTTNCSETRTVYVLIPF